MKHKYSIWPGWQIVNCSATVGMAELEAQLLLSRERRVTELYPRATWPSNLLANICLSVSKLLQTVE